MSVVPSSYLTVPDNHPSTAVLPGEWAQIIIGACGLVVMVASLAIKYRKGIKNWIIGCLHSSFHQADTEVEATDEMELHSQLSEASAILGSEYEGEEITMVIPSTEEVETNNSGIHNDDEAVDS
ncbi:hypothetical protein K440DRAFT_642514 [Wilcoxina mikolae CBS 423.85]|nr:hypothetical protein K440DRAFT_642514 [Wilcoxina mikolae CBS 423.85]